jgi:GTPase
VSEPTTEKKSGFVALVGRPNAGKSTLLNRLVGQKVAITSLVAQTTRYRIRGVMHHKLGQAVLLDTPGFSKALDSLTHYLVEQAQAGLAEADVLLWVVDASLPSGPGDRWMAEAMTRHNKPVILVLNKLDRLKQSLPLQQARKTDYMSLYPTASAVFWVSARTGKWVHQLIEQVMALLPNGPAYYPDSAVTDQRLRELAAELIREQVLRQMAEEIPHSVAVLLDEYDESQPDGVKIRATLVVNQPSQKRILIGSGGHQIKQIGIQARQAIEKLVEGPVHLALQVDVRKNWRRDARFIELLHGPSQ